ncbi:MAG: signal peptidase II [Acidobacteriota bacterium]
MTEEQQNSNDTSESASGGKLRYLIITALVLALDQGSKYWAAARLQNGDDVDVIAGLLKLSYTENSGIAFGMFANINVGWLLIAISVVAVSIVLFYLFRTPARHRLLLWSLALVAGGITGNMIDRIRMGRVIDFILAYYKSYEWPVFNVADTAITIGAALLAMELFIAPQSEKPKEDAPVIEGQTETNDL